MFLTFLDSLENFDDSVMLTYIFLPFSNGIFDTVRMKPFHLLEIDP